MSRMETVVRTRYARIDTHSTVSRDPNLVQNLAGRGIGVTASLDKLEMQGTFVGHGNAPVPIRVRNDPGRPSVAKETEGQMGARRTNGQVRGTPLVTLIPI